jgi:hypothetical protein
MSSPLSSMHSSVVASGSTKQASPTATSRPSMMARVSGRRRVTLVPEPRLAGHVDRAAQALDALPHHVHAHAAAGDIGDLLCGREAGLKDQREGLGFAQLRVGRDQPPLDGALAHRLGVDSAAVVRYGNQHAGPGVAR